MCKVVQHDWKWDVVGAQSFNHIHSPSEYYINKVSPDLGPYCFIIISCIIR